MATINQNTTNLRNILDTIDALPEAGSGGTDTSDATATASDMLKDKTAYVDGVKVTGNIPTKTASDLTASGPTVTVAPGYYPAQMTKTVSSGSAKTPATTITKTPTISVNSSGLITASVSGTQSVTPTVTTGYVSSGTAGTITVSGSATKQLTTQGAQTITPGTLNTTIASGRYLTGTQTIKGDSNLVAANIKSGVSIFGVTGTYAGSGGEDITTEVNAYTSKITSLETAVTALEEELAGKASGGGGAIVECLVTVEGDMPSDAFLFYGYSYTSPSSDNIYVDVSSEFLSNITEEFYVGLPVGSYFMIKHSGDYYLEYYCHDCDFTPYVPLDENFTIVVDLIVVTGNNPSLTIFFGGNN